MIQLILGNLLNKVETNKKDGFKNSLIQNNDYFESEDKVKFYQIDMKKLNLKNSTRGTKVDGYDVYYLAYPSFNVYYLKGVEIGNQIYFTVESSKVENINLPEIESAISLSKKEEYAGESTKKIEFNIQDGANTVKFEASENYQIDLGIRSLGSQTFYLEISGVSQRKELANIVAGRNNISFKVYELFNQNKTIDNKNIMMAKLSLADTYNFIASSPKYIKVIKKQGNEEIEVKQINIDNFILNSKSN